MEQSGWTLSTPRHSLGDLLWDAPVLEPELGLLHRLHGETLDICGSEGAAGTDGGDRGFRREEPQGPEGENPRGVGTHTGSDGRGDKPPSSPIPTLGGYTAPGSP